MLLLLPGARASLTVVVLSLAALLAACSGNTPQISGGQAAASGVSADQTATGAAFATASTEAKAAEGSFNPFADPTATPTGGREVIKDPSIADIMAPGPLPEMAQGRADAPVTIVQYASMTCPHCRHFHETTYPQLKREFIDTGKVRYILREFPIGKTSGNATIALRCAAPEKYFELYGRFMTQQPAWVSMEVRLDPIFDVAKQVGMTRPQFDACLQNQAMIANLNGIKERGRKLGIIGTPNFFVQGKLIKSELTIDDIRAAVAGGGAPQGVAAARP
jgi:protein-disulfide isomerase